MPAVGLAAPGAGDGALCGGGGVAAGGGLGPDTWLEGDTASTAGTDGVEGAVEGAVEGVVEGAVEGVVAGVVDGVLGVELVVTVGLQEGGVTGADDTTMAGTLAASLVSCATGCCCCRGLASSPVSTATGETAVAGAWTRAGVWDRLGRVLVPEAEEGGVFLPGTEEEADDWTRGERGRDFGGAGEGGRFLGLEELPSGRVL